MLLCLDECVHFRFLFYTFIENVIITLRICMHNHNATQLLHDFIAQIKWMPTQQNTTQYGNLTNFQTKRIHTNQPYCVGETFVGLFLFDVIISAGWEVLYGKWICHWNSAIVAPQHFSRACFRFYASNQQSFGKFIELFQYWIFRNYSEFEEESQQKQSIYHAWPKNTKL